MPELFKYLYSLQVTVDLKVTDIFTLTGAVVSIRSIFASKGTLAMSGDIFDSHNLRGKVLLASG